MTKFCTNCGASLGEAPKKFCGECGQSLQDSPVDKSSILKKKLKRNTIAVNAFNELSRVFHPYGGAALLDSLWQIGINEFPNLSVDLRNHFLKSREKISREYAFLPGAPTLWVIEKAKEILNYAGDLVQFQQADAMNLISAYGDHLDFETGCRIYALALLDEEFDYTRVNYGFLMSYRENENLRGYLIKLIETALSECLQYGNNEVIKVALEKNVNLETYEVVRLSKNHLINSEFSKIVELKLAKASTSKNINHRLDIAREAYVDFISRTSIKPSISVYTMLKEWKVPNLLLLFNRLDLLGNNRDYLANALQKVTPSVLYNSRIKPFEPIFNVFASNLPALFIGHSQVTHNQRSLLYENFIRNSSAKDFENLGFLLKSEWFRLDPEFVEKLWHEAYESHLLYIFDDYKSVEHLLFPLFHRMISDQRDKHFGDVEASYHERHKDGLGPIRAAFSLSPRVGQKSAFWNEVLKGDFEPSFLGLLLNDQTDDATINQIVELIKAQVAEYGIDPSQNLDDYESEVRFIA